MSRMSTRPRTQRIGIRDVAAHAGVSVGSASRVVNGAANVTPELRERVRAAIAALGRHMCFVSERGPPPFRERSRSARTCAAPRTPHRRQSG